MNSLSTYPDAFSEDPAIINDAILLTENIAADVGCPDEGITVSTTSTGALEVSFAAYQWPVAYNVRITCAKAIARMEKAIEQNRALQAHIPTFEAASRELGRYMHHDYAQVKSDYASKKAQGHIAENTEFDDYLNSVMTPLHQAYGKAERLIYKGNVDLLPNDYLASLGVTHIRLRQI